AQAQTRLTEQELRTAVRQTYYEYVSLLERRQLLAYADSIYQLFENKSVKRFESGAANLLEKTAARSHRQQVGHQLRLLKKDLEIVFHQFNLLLQDSIDYVPLSNSAVQKQTIVVDTLGVHLEGLP